MKRITAKEVQNSIKEGKNVKIIDVRENTDGGMIPGATHIPLEQIDMHVNNLDKSQEYVMVCRSGNRSGAATNYLHALGFNVSNMIGGMLVWKGDVSK